MTSPCKGCDNRAVGCHSICLKYLDYKLKMEDSNRQRVAIAAEDYIYIESVKRIKKRMNKNRKG